MERLCRLFELLGIFIAKCIQDKRRVDLPLARPFFKLMTTCTARLGYVEEGGAGEQEEEGKTEQSEGGTQSRNNEQLTEVVRNDSSQPVSNQPRQSQGPLQRPGSRGNQSVDEGAATSSKEAELQMLVAGEEEEITKDSGGEKEELVLEELGEGGGGGGALETEASWFEGILQLEDLQEVNPYR